MTLTHLELKRERMMKQKVLEQKHLLPEVAFWEVDSVMEASK